MGHSRWFQFTWWVTVVAVAAVVTLGAGDRMLTHISYAVERGRIQANSDELLDTQELASVQQVSNAFRMVAKIARPGVVHIMVRGVDEDWLRERFGNDMTDEELEEHLRRFRDGFAGSGSGIIYDEAGHIVTNNHVVGDRAAITVILDDNRQYDATVVGTDPKTDVAVIKIDAPDLHPLKFGDSDSMEVGDWVLAVGAPFGLSQTVTHGIISATGRTRVDGVAISYQNFIQTDAAINPGNSGGPLINLRGEVVGINTAIATRGEAYNAGVAFVIPSNMVRKVADELIGSGQVARGWLGITMDELSREDRELFGVDRDRGILVNYVLSGTPAEEAGILVEDVIVELNGEPVTDLARFRAKVADIKPDQTARFKIMRNQKLREIDVRLGRQPDSFAMNRLRSIGVRQIDRLGLIGRTLRPGLAARFGYDSSDRGVLIYGEQENGARRVDIDRGELVISCNGRPVDTVSELIDEIDSSTPTGETSVQVLSQNGRRRTIIIDSAK